MWTYKSVLPATLLMVFATLLPASQTYAMGDEEAALLMGLAVGTIAVVSTRHHHEHDRQRWNAYQNHHRKQHWHRKPKQDRHGYEHRPSAFRNHHYHDRHCGHYRVNDWRFSGHHKHRY